jgi:hypothetical protein
VHFFFEKLEVQTLCLPRGSAWNENKIAGAAFIKWEEYRAGTKNERRTLYIALKILRETKTFEDLRVDGVIILKWNVETRGVRVQTGLDN